MANIIMTELENQIVKPLINDGTIKFYYWYVDDTLLVVKLQYVSRFYKLLNSFDKYVKFPIDLFKNDVPLFLNLEMSTDGISVYRKDTNTGLYVNYTSFAPWTHRTAWIRSLVTCALKICSSNKLSQEFKYIVNSIFVKLFRYTKIKVSIILQQNKMNLL